MDVRLVYFDANGRRREVHLHEGIVSIGRAEECQLRIPDETVSRRHCQIEVSAREIVLTDMGSSNGTVVNDTKVVDDDVVLKAGDKITVGPATFMIIIDGKPGQVVKADETRPPQASVPSVPAVNKEVEAALAGSSPQEEEFDPLSMLEIDEDDLLDEDEEDIPPQPKQAVIPRGKPEDKRGPGGRPGSGDPKTVDQNAPKPKGKS